MTSREELISKINAANHQLGQIRKHLRKRAADIVMREQVAGHLAQAAAQSLRPELLPYRPQCKTERLTEIARSYRRKRTTIKQTVEMLDRLQRTAMHQRHLCLCLTRQWARMEPKERPATTRFLDRHARQWEMWRVLSHTWPLDKIRRVDQTAYRHLPCQTRHLDKSITAKRPVAERLRKRKERARFVQKTEEKRLVEQVEAQRKSLFRRCLRTYSGGEAFQVSLTSNFSKIRAAADIHYGWEKVGRERYFQCQGATYTLVLERGWDEYPEWLKTADNLLTLGALRASAFESSEDEEIYRAKWAVRRQGGVSVSDGFIVRQRQADGSWQTAHAKTIGSARGVLSRRRTYDPGVVREKRAKRIESALRELRAGQHGEVLVTLADSRRAGNCDSGTQQWVEEHFPNQDSATVRELLNADSGDNVRNACVAAIMRSERRARRG